MLIYNKYKTMGEQYISVILKKFHDIIAKLEEIYNVKPFNQQSPQSLAELYFLVKAIEPKTIFELGCGTRSSTIALAIAAAELSHECKVYGIDISPIKFNDFVAKYFRKFRFAPVIDYAINAVDFEIDDNWEKPIFTLYDAHDDDVPGVKIFPHAKRNWVPKLKNQIIAVHDCSVFCSRVPHIPEDHFANFHFSGRYVVGYGEVVDLIDWMNEKKIDLFRPGDELEKLGFNGSDSSLIYFKVPGESDGFLYRGENREP